MHYYSYPFVVVDDVAAPTHCSTGRLPLSLPPTLLLHHLFHIDGVTRRMSQLDVPPVISHHYLILRRIYKASSSKVGVRLCCICTMIVASGFPTFHSITVRRIAPSPHPTPLPPPFFFPVSPPLLDLVFFFSAGFRPYSPMRRSPCLPCCPPDGRRILRLARSGGGLQ